MCGPNYMPYIPNLHHCIQNCALEVLITVYWAELLSVFILKPFAFFFPTVLVTTPNIKKAICLVYKN